VKPQIGGQLLEHVFVNTHCLVDPSVPSRVAGHSTCHREGLVLPPTVIPSDQTSRSMLPVRITHRISRQAVGYSSGVKWRWKTFETILHSRLTFTNDT
jgi:hypothetical protein